MGSNVNTSRSANLGWVSLLAIKAARMRFCKKSLNLRQIRSIEIICMSGISSRTGYTRTWALLTIALISPLAAGCGLDWTLPVNHFDGVEEHGYVSYWEKIGEIDLGDGLVIPVNINFNSHREADSPYLGKGWIVALLESHVEPLDENKVKVVMPDGWNFYFQRDGNTDTWHGNAGWVGETTGAHFTIAAPCGWRIRFDGGKIQEIQGPKNQTLSYKYNGSVATEVEVNGKSCIEAETSGGSGGAASLVLADRKIDISVGQRPDVAAKQGQNLVAGFDPALSRLQWADGRSETFTFGTDAGLNPNLVITSPEGSRRAFTWNATTRQIKADGSWLYHVEQIDDHMKFERTSVDGLTENYEADDARGVTTISGEGGKEIATYRFVSGPLAGRVRKIEEQANGSRITLYSASYFPSGIIMREAFYPDRVRTYSETGRLLKETTGSKVTYEQDYDAQGHLVHIVNPAKEIGMKRTFDSRGSQITKVFKNGTLFYTETVDSNNNLVSFEKGAP